MLNFYETFRTNFLFESSFIDICFIGYYFKNYWHGFFQNIKFKVNSLFFILSFILLTCKFINNYISLFANLETVLFFLKIELRIENCFTFGKYAYAI